jgi:CelD/BcsL family acetyltransferase involved in cellulose biosynthesis
MSSTALFRPETKIAQGKIERLGPLPVATSLGTISLRITSEPESLKSLWEALQATAACTAAQTYDWALAWTRNVLGPEGREPVIVVGYGPGGAPMFLWAFEMGTKFGLQVLNWLGQDHANYNMGLFTPEAARTLTAPDMSRLLQEAGRQVGAAAAILESQPFAWDGVPNPFATLPHRPAPNSAYAIKLGDFTKLYESRFSRRSRSTLERKERKLLDLGRLDYGWAETREERIALLETFFAQKARQLAAMGVKNIFDAHARDFYRDLALLEGDNPSRLRLGYVKLNGHVLATFNGTICHDRLAVALSSLAEGDRQRQSPGALLLRHQIEEASNAGLAYYDLGVGQARHKDEWCNVVYELFDSFVAFRAQGLFLTLPLATAARLKRAIKSNSMLWSLAQQVRKRLLSRKG